MSDHNNSPARSDDPAGDRPGRHRAGTGDGATVPRPDGPAAEAAIGAHEHPINAHEMDQLRGETPPVQHDSPSGAVVAAEQVTTADAVKDDPGTAPAVVARGIAVKGEEGPVYGPLDVTIPGKGLTILTGRGGSGRTALALTISGRMRPDSGRLTVLGMTKRSQIRKRVAIAGVDDIDLIDRDVRLRTVLTEHRAWCTPWIMWAKKADQEYYESLCKGVYGQRDLPPLDAYVSQISGLDRYLIRMALALHPANGNEIGLLVMDDLEQVHEFTDRVILMNILARLAEDIPVVINAVNPLPEFLVPDYTLIELFTDAAHLLPENPGQHPDPALLSKELHL